MKKLALLLSLLLTLGACTTLPKEGPVNATRALETSGTNVDLYAAGPVDGASPEQIIEGFLNASAAGINDDFRVAKQFLTDEAASSWVPLQNVRVYSDARVLEFSQAESGALRLDLTSEATIDEDGRFQPSEGDATITTEFSLARNEAGEWRIVALEDGLLLTSTLFSTQYARAPLYFLTSDSNYMVPDVRYLPRSSLATSLAIELIDGPSPWMAESVRTLVPEGTRLGGAGIVIEDGTLTVSLSNEVLALSADDQALLKAQFEKSFAGMLNIQDIVLSVDGAPLGIAETPELSSYPYSTSSLLALTSQGPGLYSDGQFVPLDIGEVPDNLSHLARGYGEDAVMVGISDGRILTTLPNDGSMPRSLIYQTNPIPPSVDRYGWVWSGPRNAAGYFSVADKDGLNIRVAAPWLTEGTISSIHISREGSRAIVVWNEGTQQHISATSVIRNPAGRPARLSEPVDIGGSFEQITDVAWMSDTDVVILGTRTATSNLGLYSATVGGPVTLIQEVSGASSVTAGSTENSIIVSTESNLVLERSEGAWRRLIENATSPALPG